jgi:hypothetical protein
MLKQIDTIVRDSLTEFVADVFGSSWKGREREAVSLYAFGYLQRQIRKGGILRDPTQIGIEVTVPSKKSLNPKGRVCKDLVLWREPNMTCWDAEWKIVHPPLVIMEWKVSQPKNRNAVIEWENRDIPWLQKYTKTYSDTVGYAVLLDLLRQQLNVARLHRGTFVHDWLMIGNRAHT